MANDQKNDGINVVLICDKNMEVGLHLTVVSFLRRVSKKVFIHLFQEGFSKKDLQKLELSIFPFSDRAKLKVYKINESRFNDTPGWFGKKIVYVLLTLPEILPLKKILYLDCDLLVNLDIAELYNTVTDNYVLAAYSNEKAEDAWESEFLIKRGMKPESFYMNTGVLVVDCDLWREQKITARCLEMAKNEKEPFPTVDQTILNLIFKGAFKKLASHVQAGAQPHQKHNPEELKKTIYHFIMVPKPWELFGEYFHESHKLFKNEMKGTIFENRNSWNSISITKIWRMIRTIKMYFHVLKMRTKKYEQ